MANTKIPVELSSTPGIVDGSNATAITIDSSENVGIGETSPLAKLHIKLGDSGLSSLNAAGNHIFLENTGSNGTGITLASGNTANGSIIFGDEDSNYRGVLIYDHSADAMKFVTAASERMRIDSSGNVGIGTTPASASSTTRMHIHNGASTAILQLTGAGVGTTASDGTELAADDNGDFRIRNFESGSMQFFNNGSERMRIDASGNVGIGITSVAAELHVNETNAGGLGGRMLIQNNSSTSGSYCQLILAPTAATAADRCVVIQAENTDGNNNQAMVFKTSEGSSPAERMRVTPNGILVVGASAAFTSGGTNSGAGQLCVASNNATAVHFKRAGGDGGLVNFIRGGITNPVGSISITTSATSFNTSSDARLKNVLGEAKGLEIINKLNPINFEWKESKNVQDGLIAQEVAELIPHAVTQNDSGFYQMDYSKLVTPLIKAIQEQQTLIETQQTTINDLKSRIETLEG
jgi:hypothetical protein